MRKLAIGIYDNPLKQEQSIFNIDLLKNNIIVFGGPMTGKTTFLKTLLVRIHENAFQNNNIEEEIYILDFGNSLGAYSNLYNICGYFNSSNEENIKRVFKVIEEKMNINSNTLSKCNQNFVAYCECSKEKDLHHITFIIDNANAFFSENTYTTYQEKLLEFCRDGLSKGITIILTANDTGISNKFLSNFGQKIAFQVPNDKYIEIFGSRTNQPMCFKGRGLATIDSNILEFQCFLPFKDESTELSSFIDSTNQNKEKNPNRLISFDGDLTFENLKKYTSSNIPKDKAIVGLDYYNHLPIEIDLKENKVIAIYGKKNFGQINLLNILVKYIIEHQKEIFHFDNDTDKCNIVLFDDGRKQLEGIKKSSNVLNSSKIQYFLKINEFKDYIDNNHMIINRANHTIRENRQEILIPIQETPNTVFIIQNKMFFQNAPLINVFSSLVSQAPDYNYIFIYPDIPLISEAEIASKFNSTILNAFLLDNISEFVNNKSKNTIFQNMNAKELKEKYAKCERGDGYYYDFDTDTIEKLKFIKLNSLDNN